MHLTEQQVADFQRDGCVFPIRVLSAAEAARLPRPPRDARGDRRRAAAGQPAAQDAPALHLGRRARPPPGDPRRGGRRDRPRHPLLDDQLLHQGAEQRRLRVVAPGLDLLGARPGRRRHRLGRLHRRDAGERLHAVHPRHAQGRPAAAPRHLPSRQPAVARPGDRGRGRPVEGGRHRPCRPARCRSITSSWCTARSRTAAADRRIGFAIRYIPTYVRQTKVRDSAMLVRGTDKYRNFDDEPRPQADMDAAAHSPRTPKRWTAR